MKFHKNFITIINERRAFPVINNKILKTNKTDTKKIVQNVSIETTSLIRDNVDV